MYDVVNNLKPDLLIRASMVNSNLLFPQVNLRNQMKCFDLTNNIEMYSMKEQRPVMVYC